MAVNRWFAKCDEVVRIAFRQGYEKQIALGPLNQSIKVAGGFDERTLLRYFDAMRTLGYIKIMKPGVFSWGPRAKQVIKNETKS